MTAYSLSGTKARNLWFVAAVFVVVSLLWLARPTAINIDPMRAFQYLLLVMPLLTVSLVALLVRDRAPTKMSELPIVVQKRPDSDVSYDLGLQIKRVIRQARSEQRSDDTVRGVEKAYHPVKALMLTLTKDKGIVWPAPCKDVRLDLEAALRIMEEIAPLIQSGHDAEAQTASEEWVKKSSKSKSVK